MRLDQYLAQKLDITRSQILKAIKSGAVTVNGVQITKSGTNITDSDNVVANIENPISTVLPENIPLNIVFEDEYLMVINKPRGMTVHPGAGQKSGTMLNALLGQNTNHELERGGIVHRLDKNTAGLIVVAKNADVQAKLSAMFEKRQVKRVYNGIIDGVLHGSGVIDTNIIRDPNHRTMFRTTQQGGRKAITHFRVLQTFQKFSLVEFRLETGRTHQIRVHCKSIGRPIVGDPEYNPNGKIKCSGQMLESIEIAFIHPITSKEIEIKIGYSDEFRTVFEKICKN